MRRKESVAQQRDETGVKWPQALHKRFLIRER